MWRSEHLTALLLCVPYTCLLLAESAHRKLQNVNLNLNQNLYAADPQASFGLFAFFFWNQFHENVL